MKLLFTSIEQVSQHAPANVSQSFESLQPRLYDAQEKLIVPIIGRDILNSLILKNEDSNYSAIERELIMLVQYPIVHAAFADAAADMNVNAKNGGFTVNTDTENQAASGYRVEAWITARNRDAQKGIDRLLVFLEENITDFPDYASSIERINERSLFINNTDEINNFLTITINRYVFVKMKPVMRRIQEWVIREVLCEALYNHMLLKIQNKEDLEAYEPLLKLVQRVLAHLAIASAIDEIGIQVDTQNGAFLQFSKNANEPRQTKSIEGLANDRLREQNEKNGNQSLSILKDHLVTKHADYPLYNTSPCYAGTQVRSVNAMEGVDGFMLGHGFSKTNS